jgi:hypothetical protein
MAMSRHPPLEVPFVKFIGGLSEKNKAPIMLLLVLVFGFWEGKRCTTT